MADRLDHGAGESVSYAPKASGDSVIEYRLRPEALEKNSDNMNFIAYATHLDGDRSSDHQT